MLSDRPLLVPSLRASGGGDAAGGGDAHTSWLSAAVVSVVFEAELKRERSEESSSSPADIREKKNAKAAWPECNNHTRMLKLQHSPAFELRKLEVGEGREEQPAPRASPPHSITACQGRTKMR